MHVVFPYPDPDIAYWSTAIMPNDQDGVAGLVNLCHSYFPKHPMPFRSGSVCANVTLTAAKALSFQLTIAFMDLANLQDTSLRIIINDPNQLNSGYIFGNLHTTMPFEMERFSTGIRHHLITLTVEEITKINLVKRPCQEHVENENNTLPR